MRDLAFGAVPLKREQNTMSGDKLSFSKATVFLQILRQMLPPSGKKVQSADATALPSSLLGHSFPWAGKEEFCFGFLSFLSLCMHNADRLKKIKPP